MALKYYRSSHVLTFSNYLHKIDEVGLPLILIIVIFLSILFLATKWYLFPCAGMSDMNSQTTMCKRRLKERVLERQKNFKTWQSHHLDHPDTMDTKTFQYWSLVSIAETSNRHVATMLAWPNQIVPFQPYIYTPTLSYLTMHAKNTKISTLPKVQPWMKKGRGGGLRRMPEMSGTGGFGGGRGGSSRRRFETPRGRVRGCGWGLSTLRRKRPEPMIELLMP